MQSLNRIKTADSIDDQNDAENLKIITHPKPPRRRQSGISIIPFRPYVKFLTGVRQTFSFTDGTNSWKISGNEEIFLRQPNARCIGTLIDDCQISDVIRWDIQAESTYLPMMCKLWIITDGAVIERGKPQLVQDTAVQVFTTGHHLRSILTNEKRFNQLLNDQRINRRRRQSWHELNEYHSVPYYQYSRAIRLGVEQSIQCNLDQTISTTQKSILARMQEEENIEDNANVNLNSKKEKIHERIHQSLTLLDRVQISTMTQTELSSFDKSTSTDSQLIRLFNLSLERNEILLSSIANPYRTVQQSNITEKTYSYLFDNKEYQDCSTSTGDDYPPYWLQFSTDFILSDQNIDQNIIEKEKSRNSPSLTRQQFFQNEINPIHRVSRTKNESSSSTVNNYEIFDENNSNRSNIDQLNSRRSIIRSSSHNKIENSLKRSDTGYNTFISSMNYNYSPSSSTPDLQPSTSRKNQRNISESSSTSLLSAIAERYERTLRERQRAFTIINHQLLDVDDVLNRYRNKVNHQKSTSSSSLIAPTSISNGSNEISSQAIEFYQPNPMESYRSRDDSTYLNGSLSNQLIDKYRSMPGVTSDEMIRGYIPSPRLSLIITPNQRSPRFIDSTLISPRTKYCDLCVTDNQTSSAWIRYNEQRIEDLQKRIDYMLKIDDHEEAQLLLKPIDSIRTMPKKPVTERINELMMRKSRFDLGSISRHDLNENENRTNRSLTSSEFHENSSTYRTNESSATTPRRLNQIEISRRATTPVQKTVRISLTPTRVSSSSPIRQRSSSKTSSSLPRPIVSILRRNSAPISPKSSKSSPPLHVWKSKVDGNVYVLEQFSIPRYYRLYNDVSFREIYNFSRALDAYLTPNQINHDNYSSMLKSFALENPPTSSVAGAV